MNIVILGAGEIGSYLAKLLSQEEHNVILIDKDETILEKIQRETDISTVKGFGTSWKTFDNLLENKPDLFIAMTGNDETNLVACSIAKNLGYPKSVARIKEISILAKSRIDFSKLFYVDHFIGVELITAHDILKNILHPGHLAIENFAHGTIQMRTIAITDTWKKKEIPLMKLNLPEEIIIALIKRRKKEEITDPHEMEDEIIFPHGTDTILPGDEITIIGDTKTMYDIDKYFDTPKEKIDSATIVGGTSICVFLAKILHRQNIAVKIIEKDEKRCFELSNILPNATIFNQNGKNIEFLLSENINETGAFIACTHRDENNLLISLVGKQAKCKKIITLFSDIAISPILQNLNIKFAISEKTNIINRILSIIHAKKAISIASLANSRARVVELKVSADSEIVGIPLADLATRLPKDLIIAAIENKGRVMIGKGNKIISPHDTVIIITSPQRLNELQQLF